MTTAVITGTVTLTGAPDGAARINVYYVPGERVYGATGGGTLVSSTRTADDGTWSVTLQYNSELDSGSWYRVSDGHHATRNIVAVAGGPYDVDAVAIQFTPSTGVSTTSGEFTEAGPSKHGLHAASRDYADSAGGGGGSTPDADATTKGKLKLAGDLGGTAALPTVPGLAGKAATSHTHAAADVASGTLASARLPAATGAAQGAVVLTGDLGGSASSPTVPGLAGKEPSITATTTSDYYRGDKTFVALDKAAVGLGNVTNTSDANKPVSTAQQTALDLKANASTAALDSGVVHNTGTETIAGSKTFSSAPVVPSASFPQAATTNLVSDLAAKAPLASPALTGVPTAPTASASTNTTQVATTAYADAGLALKAASSHSHAQADVTSLVADLALKAPLASPALTGTPTAPTAAVSTNTTQLATTAFVLANAGATTSYVDTADALRSRKDVQSFTSTGSGTFTIPSWAVATTMTQIEIIGGGGGGGAGDRGAVSTARVGGAGGSGAAVSRLLVKTLSMGAASATVSVTVGAGGAGGIAQTSDGTAGATGTAGGTSSVGTFASAGGGPAGVGGGNGTGGTAGGTSTGQLSGGNGGTSPTTPAAGNTPANVSGGAAGGGGGAGITNANPGTAANGGAGAITYANNGAVGAAGVTGSTSPTTGQDAAAGNPAPGAGGGGGASHATTAQAGAAGGKYGGGGGGGGASTNGANSGAGGAGANGIIVMTTWE